LKKMNEPKEKILDLLWKTEAPVNLKEVAQKTGLKTRAANMHLLRLTKSGHILKSKDGLYTITDVGKEAIGLPKIDQKTARRILSKTPPEKAFQFYSGIDQPTGISSDNLIDLCEKVKTLNIKPVEFHTARGDFELWVSSLGDIELAKKLRLIRETGLTGDLLRERLHKVLKSRCDELLKK